METNRNTAQDKLERNKIIFTEIGLIIALAVVFLALEWKSTEKTLPDLGTRQVEDVLEEIIPITEQKVKPPPPPSPSQVVQINVVDDDVDVEDEVLIDAEADENTEIQEYIPIPDIVVEEEVVEEAPIFTVVESSPEFPGGLQALYKYLEDNIKYPVMAKGAGITGKVYLTFVVEKDGSITDIEILRGIGGGCDEEAVRVVENMPKWTPGKQRGKPVRVQYNLPVRFTLL